MIHLPNCSVPDVSSITTCLIHGKFSRPVQCTKNFERSVVKDLCMLLLDDGFWTGISDEGAL